MFLKRKAFMNGILAKISVGFVIFLSGLVLGVFHPGGAQSAESVPIEKTQILSAKQAQKIAKQVSLALLREPFFAEQELPVKIALGLMVLDVPAETKTVDFTNLVLMYLLEDNSVMIMNQDLNFSDTRSFRLSSYNDVNNLRIRGKMLGANYYLIGNLKNYSDVQESGKVKNHYLLDLSFVDIQTQKIIISKNLEFTGKGKLIKAKKIQRK